MMIDPEHLGDGAYASIRMDRSLTLTANDSDPARATDTVYIDAANVPALLSYIDRHRAELCLP